MTLIANARSFLLLVCYTPDNLNTGWFMKTNGCRFWVVALMVGLSSGLGVPQVYAEPPAAQAPTAPLFKQLVPGIWVSSQVLPDELAASRYQGFSGVIDFRPDGEASDQPSSGQMRQSAEALHWRFDYIPVPHGPIPDKAVTQLAAALAKPTDGMVLFYCRSGKRAVRTWALYEASRSGGRDYAAINAVVRATGFDATDLQAEISQRIQHRKR